MASIYFVITDKKVLNWKMPTHALHQGKAQIRKRKENSNNLKFWNQIRASIKKKLSKELDTASRKHCILTGNAQVTIGPH